MKGQSFPVTWTLLAGGLFLALVFGLCHAIGWREYTTILTGSLPPGVDPGSAEVGALLYLLAWFGWTVGTPVCLIAAALAAILERRLDAPSEA